MLLFRFAYGLRAVAPVTIGASRLPTWLFVPLNIVAAILWGSLLTGLGYLTGPAFGRGEARDGMGIAVATVCVSVAVFVLALRQGRWGRTGCDKVLREERLLCAPISVICRSVRLSRKLPSV